MALTIHRTRRAKPAPVESQNSVLEAKVIALEAELQKLRDTVDAILDALYQEFELEIEEDEE